jgi:xylitol oxidase
MIDQGRNWAGNLTYGAAARHAPETVEQIQDLVRRSHRVKALGSRHSFNDIADSPGDLISLVRFAPEPVFDRAAHTVTVGAGATYGQLGPVLHRAGYALPNLASLPHISVAGACATATHGSGVGLGNLATVVSALELVTADGARRILSRERDGDQLAGAVVGLGALGVVTRLTLALVPAFAMRQDLYEDLPLAELDAHFDEIMGGASSVSLFTDWQAEEVNQVWLKQPVAADVPVAAAPAQWFGATLAPAPRHPIARLSAEPCTEQMGWPGPWYARLPHFRLEFTPSSGAELQSEYLVPHPHALGALHAVMDLRAELAPLLQISEVRTIAADDLWMSPCYGQDCVAFHFTWTQDGAAVRDLLPRLEDALAPFQPRPHWGKLFTMPPAAVQALYPRLPDFQALLRALDPEGKFRNAFLDRYIYGVA